MMKKFNILFLVLFISTPVFACKMTRESWEKKSEAEARAAVTKKTGQKDLHSRREKQIWIVRTTKPTCLEFQVKVNGGGTCVFTSEILSERACP